MSTDFVIGQKAAIYSNRFGEASVSTTTVERETKLYWVVTGGRKFRKRDCVEPSGDMWRIPAMLCQVDDPAVVRAAREQHVSRMYGGVMSAVDALRGDKQNMELIDALELALKEYKAVLEA